MLKVPIIFADVHAGCHLHKHCERVSPVGLVDSQSLRAEAHPEEPEELESELDEGDADAAQGTEKESLPIS